MPTGVELGTYYVSVVPSARGASGALQSQLGPEVDRAAGRAKTSLSGGITAGAREGAENAKASSRAIGGEMESLGGVASRVIGGIALGGLVRSAFGEADEARKVGAQTEAVLRSTGGAANVTAAEVGDLATSLSNLAGVDDELIQSGANLLLTFKSVRNEAGAGNDIFNQATAIALDMSKALGTDLTSAVTMVGKALEDPIRGVTALRRVGANFTTDQMDQIRVMVATGRQMDAQKLILRELTTEYGGSAAAQATATDKMKVAAGNLAEKLGTALMPAFDLVANVGLKVAGVFDALPGPMQTVAGLALVGGVGWATFGGAITAAVTAVGGWVASAGAIVTGATVSTAAVEGLAGAMSAEAAAAGGAAAANTTMAGSARLTGGSMAGAAGKVTLVAAAFWGLGKGLGAATDKIYGAAPAVDSLATALANLAATGHEQGALQQYGGLDKIVKDLKKLQDTSTGAKGVLSDTTNAILHIGTLGGISGHTPIDNLTKKVDAVDQALASMVKGGNVEGAKTAFDQIANAAMNQGMTLDQVKHLYQDYSQAALDAGVAADTAATGVDTLGGAMEDAASKTPLTDALSGMRQMADDAAASLHEVAGAAREALGIRLAVPEAVDKQADARDQFEQALKDARANGYRGDFMTGTDATSRDIRGKYRELQQANADLVGAWRESGIAGDALKQKVNELGGAFASTQNVYLGKAAVDDYTASLHLMMQATDQAQAKIDALNWAKITDALNEAQGLSLTASVVAKLTPAQLSNPVVLGGVQGLLDLASSGGRASGGPVRAGELYRVNERGMEYFRPSVDGSVIPMGQASGGGVTIQQHFTDARPSAAEIARESAAHANWALTGRAGR